MHFGLIHTETLSCVFVLFTVLKGIENNQLITWNNTKTQENVSVCTGPMRSPYRTHCGTSKQEQRMRHGYCLE